MAHGSASEVSAKWLSRLQQSQAEMQQGVARVTQAPGQAAAAKRQKWINALSDPATQDKWARNVASVSLATWQQAMNSPWYAYGVSFDDVVYAPIRDGQPTFAHVVEHGGRCTLRARVDHERDVADVCSRLNELGCEVEYYREDTRGWTLIAINVIPSDLAEVRAYLSEETKAGRLDYEESAVPID